MELDDDVDSGRRSAALGLGGGGGGDDDDDDRRELLNQHESVDLGDLASGHQHVHLRLGAAADRGRLGHGGLELAGGGKRGDKGGNDASATFELETADEGMDGLDVDDGAPAYRTRSYDDAMSSKPMLSTGRLLALNTLWMVYQLFWFVLYIVALPSQVIHIVGEDEKGYAMFVIFMVGGFINFFVSVIVGYVADRVYSPFGRRYSWLSVGTGLLVLCTVGMMFVDSLASLTLVYALISTVSVAISVPYNGLLADVVNRQQRGRASAIMGALGVLGYVMGACIGLLYTTLGNYGSYGVICGLFVIAFFVTYAFIKEPHFTRADLARIRREDAGTHSYGRALLNCAPLLRDEVAWSMSGWMCEAPVVRERNLMGKGQPTSKVVYAMRWTYATVLFPLFEPLLHNRDFFWVFLTRFFMQLGQYTIQEFVQYWLHDCVELPVIGGEPLSPETAVSAFMLPMLLGASIAALASGYLSDRLGGRRRIWIYASGVLMVGVCLALIVIKNFYAGIVVSVFLGLGYGTYLAVDFAIVMDVLPSKDDVARDIALWHLSLVLPQIFATPLAGLLLDAFQGIGDEAGIVCLGYTVIWVITAVYFCLGSAFIGRVRGIR